MAKQPGPGLRPPDPAPPTVTGAHWLESGPECPWSWDPQGARRALAWGLQWLIRRLDGDRMAAWPACLVWQREPSSIPKAQKPFCSIVPLAAPAPELSRSCTLLARHRAPAGTSRDCNRQRLLQLNALIPTKHSQLWWRS